MPNDKHALPLWNAAQAPLAAPVAVKTPAAAAPPKTDWPATQAKRVAALGGAGVLTTDDVPDLDAGCIRVLAFMRDHEWHSAESIIAASGQREGLRRMRELRRLFAVERRRVGGKRDWEYRLGEPTPRASTE